MSLLTNSTEPPTPIVTVAGRKHSFVSSQPGVDEPIPFSTTACILCSANALGADAIVVAIAKRTINEPIVFVFISINLTWVNINDLSISAHFTSVLGQFLFPLRSQSHMQYRLAFLALFMISPLLMGNAFAHQADAVGDYRIEIDWKNWPVVTGESNAIIVYVSILDKSLEPADQEFVSAKGIEGLKKTLKIQLVVDEEKITLPLQPTEIPGKYESPITPTFSGWSQLNILGTINDTNANLALHPKKVEEPSFLQFPPVESNQVEIDDFNREIDDLRGDIRELQETINELKQEPSNDNSGIMFAAIGLGIAGIIIGAASFAKKK